MPKEREQRQGELEQLTSAIREMASRVNVQFVVDDEKSQSFVAASERNSRGGSTILS